LPGPAGPKVTDIDSMFLIAIGTILVIFGNINKLNMVRFVSRRAMRDLQGLRDPQQLQVVLDLR
jgi:uncharacterized membrane protein